MQSSALAYSNDRHEGGFLGEPTAGHVDSCTEEACVCPKDARKEAVNEMKRNLIMDAAIRVTGKIGYIDARIDDIATEAGFSKAAIYHYFPDKESLYIHVIIRELRKEHESCLEIISRNMPFMDTVKAFVELFFNNKALEDNSPVKGGTPVSNMLSIFSSMSKHADLMQECAKCKIATYTLLKDVVAKARAEGVIDIPVEDVAVCMMITSFVHYSYMRKKMYESSPEAFTESININTEWVVNSITAYLKPYLKESK